MSHTQKATRKGYENVSAVLFIFAGVKSTSVDQMIDSNCKMLVFAGQFFFLNKLLLW